MPDRHTMTPSEYAAAKRELERRCPFLSGTSGRRSKKHNAAVGGHADSKHLYGIADDYVSDSGRYAEAAEIAFSLGLWFKHGRKGGEDFLHVQGAARGPLPEWWLEKYWSPQ